jgi:putative flippase GtrA
MLSTKKLTFNHLVKYFLTVLLGFLFDFFIYFYLVYNKLSPYTSNSISFFLGAILTVILLRTFVFQKNNFSLLKDIILTLSSNGITYLIGMVILFCSINIFNFGPFFSKIIANGVTLLFNYIIRLSFFSPQ